MTNPLTELQQERNLNVDDQFHDSLNHRSTVTEELLRGLSEQSGRLCVLGAGNCHDIDLPKLTQHFREIHLVDLDTDALNRAMVRQNVADSPSIYTHGETDLTGVWDQMADWLVNTVPSQQKVASTISKAARGPQCNVPGKFEMVASVCLLSQLIEGAVKSLGESHSQFADMVRAIRLGHLKLMIELIKPGGHGLLVTDIVSSVTAPALENTPNDLLPTYVADLINQHNFFHGLNPAFLCAIFGSDPEVAPHIDGYQLLNPWKWKLGKRVYAVTAIKFRCK